MYKIQTYDKLAKAGYDTFDLNRYSIENEQDNPDGILVHSTPLFNINFGDNLKSIVRIGAGVNTIPVAELTQKGVAVFNCPGGNANAVKELTISAMIQVMRNGVLAMNWVKALPDEETEQGKVIEKGKSRFRGPEIMGKTIGVVGAGAIGSIMMKSCQALGMKVLAYDPYLSKEKVNNLSQYGRFVKDIDELLKESDIVTIHIPFNKENEKFIDAKKIEKMKDGVYVINYARGQIMDNDAICDYIENGKIAGFATDFPTPREMKLDKVFFTPHLGAGTPEADINCSVMAANQTMDYIENGNVVNSVNFPNVSFARSGGTRICVLHKNVVGMLGKFTDACVSLGLNIENLINKSRDGIAYTIMDFDNTIDGKLKEMIAAIAEVIMVRQID